MSKKVKIGESEEIIVIRQDPHFDFACESAHRHAVQKFEIDQYGHSDRVNGWERSCCWVEIEFVSYRGSVGNHCYKFTATTKKSDDSDDYED